MEEGGEMWAGRGGRGEKRREESNTDSNHRSTGSRRDRSRPGPHASAGVRDCARVHAYVRSPPE